MTREQLEKDFEIPGVPWSISRSDYEDMPSPMAAHLFSDEQMQDLADEIGNYFFPEEEYPNQPEPEYREHNDEQFWTIMEQCAVRMGMKYYEDMK